MSIRPSTKIPQGTKCVNILKLYTPDMGGVSLYVTIGMGNLADNIGRDLTIFGSSEREAV